MSKLYHNVTIERDHFSKKTKELEDRQQTIEQELIRSYQIGPATPLVDPHKSPAPNGLVPAMDPALPIHLETPPKVTFVPETPKPAYPVANPVPLYPSQPIVEKPRISDDLSLLPGDIDADDITILQSMGFNLNDRPQLIFDLIRKHPKDISKVIEELLKNNK